MAELDNIASQLLKSASEADKIYSKTRDQSQKDKATRLRVIVQNLRNITLGASDLNGLSDVTISAPANAQVLAYNSSTGQWENQTGGGGGGGDMTKSVYDVDNDGIVDGSETTQIIVRNSTGTTLTKGTVVYLSGATGNRPNAVRAQANTEATSSKTIGIVVANIANNADGFVATNGTLHDLDTSAFTAGDAVWLSAATAGGMTSTIPAEPNHTVFIGYIARAHPTQGRIVILIQNGYELNELHGVLISSEANNDLLVYETSSTLWKNKSISTIFGGTPLVSVPTLDQVTTAGNTTTNAITVGGLNVNGIQLITSADVVNRDVGPAAFSVTNGTFSRFNLVYDAAVARVNILGTSTEGLRIEGGSGASITKIGSGGIVISAPSNNLYLNGGSLLLATGNVERARINSSGNVLIGTTTDAGYKLDVNGTGRYSSTLTIQTAASDASPSNSILISTSSSGNGGRISWGDSNTSILRYSNSLYFREYTGNFRFESTGSGAALLHISGAATTVFSGSFITSGSITAASSLARGVYFNNTLVAAANNDVLVGLDINPTFTNGAFTGVDNWDLRTKGKVLVSSTTTGNVFPLVVRSTNYPGILLQSGSTGTNHSAAPYDGFAFWINYDVSHAKGLITNYENNGISIYNGTNPAVGLTIFGSTNNVAINTTTDAGYKLQVQGVGYFNTNTASTSSVLRLTDATTGTAWVGFSSVTTTGFFIGSNGGMTLGHVTADNSNPSTAHARISINPLGNPGLSLSTNSANVGIVFSDGVNGTIRMNFPSSGEAAITTISAHNLSIGVAASTGSLSSTTMKFFQSTGNVAIGTTTDAGYKLDVNGSTRLDGNLTLGGWVTKSTATSLTFFGNVASGTGDNFIFYDNNGFNTSGTNILNFLRLSSLGTWVTQNSGIGNVLNINPTVSIASNTTSSSIFRGIYYNPSVTILGSGLHRAIETTSGDIIFNGGNVGIGTASPSYPFHISSAAAANIYGTVQSTNANGTAAWVAFNDQSDNVVYRVFGSGASGTQMGIALARSASLMANLGGSGKFLLGTYSNTDFIMGTGNAEKMRIVDSTGNILIATTTDLGNKLEVNGNINSTGYSLNNTAGYTGTLVIVTNPPGQQNIDIRGGIIVNVF